MVDFISGTLVAKNPAKVVVEANGIGFALLIPLSTYDRLPDTGCPVNLKSYLHVREDALQLFGFLTDAERTLFVLLISHVSGIGPKLAINIISSMSVESFCSAIAAADGKALSRINGVGKRSAERLIIELKDKIQLLSPSAGFGDADSQLHGTVLKAVDDAIAGLITLGFRAESARKAVHDLAKGMAPAEVTPEALLRRALQTLKA